MWLPRLVVLAGVFCLFISAYCLHVDKQPAGVIWLAAGVFSALILGFLLVRMVKRDRAKVQNVCPMGHALPDGVVSRHQDRVMARDGIILVVDYEACPLCREVWEEVCRTSDAQRPNRLSVGPG